MGRRGLFLKCFEEPSPSARKRDAYDDHHKADDADKAHDWETGEVHLMGGVTLDAGKCQCPDEERKKNQEGRKDKKRILNSGNGKRDPVGRVGKVPGTGLEPARLATPDPKSGVSANFTTPAFTLSNAHNGVFSIPYV